VLISDERIDGLDIFSKIVLLFTKFRVHVRQCTRTLKQNKKNYLCDMLNASAYPL
jgi:hypothetical protein